MTTTSSRGGRTVFLREATGLIRDFAMIDALIFAIGAMIGPTWVPIFYGEWYLFPGVSIPASFVLIGLFSLANGIYYVFITAVMPRSGGGGYVPLSRTIHPILGMGMSMILVVAFLLDMGFIGNITFTTGVSGPLATYATITKNAGLASLASSLGTPTGGLVTGTIMIFLIGLLAISGNRFIKLANKIAFAIGTLGMILIIGVLLTTSQSQFATAFNNFAGAGQYQNVTNTATRLGWNNHVNWINPTFLSLPLSFFAILGYAFNTYYGGEVRKISRSMSIAVVGSIIFTGFFFSVIAALALNAFGTDFITSAGFLGNTIQPNSSSSYWTYGPPPYVNTFVAIANSNLLINLIIIVSFVCWGYLLIINYYFISSRLFLAWSFDRSVPSVFGRVSDRLHSPVLALVIAGIIGWVALLFYVYLPSDIGAVNLTFFFIVALLLDGLAGIALPLRNKSALESAPSFARKRVGGVPVISILGAYSIIFVGYLFVESLYNPAAVGAFGTGTILTIIAAFIIGAVAYAGMKVYYSGKGMDIGLAFKEIPPE